MDSITSSIKAACLSRGFNQTYWIGFSGGMDSHVLLHSLAKLRQELPLKLHAVYVNHSLSPNAEAWAQHCRAVCRKEGVVFTDFKVDAKAQLLESPEAFAREKRYALFGELLQEGDVLFTAHHQDDQAETVLLQLFRGAGPKGLSAMPFARKFYKGKLIRPFLNLTRETLHAYADLQALEWIEDESNTNTQFMRNFLRHDILSLVKKRLPSVTQTLARVAQNCGEMQSLLDDVITHDLKNCAGSKLQTLSIKKLASYPPVRQRFILRAFLGELGFVLPSAVKLRVMLDNMLNAKEDKLPCITWGKVELRRYRDDLYGMQTQPLPEKDFYLEWDFLQPLTFTAGSLMANLQEGEGLDARINKVSVRFRQGGETICLPNRSFHHDVKKLFQTLDVPPWLRDRIPFIYVEGELAAIAGLVVSAKYRTEKDKMGRVLSFSQ